MWPIGGLVLVATGLLPSAWHWISAAAAADEVRRESTAAFTQDAVFVLGALLFLKVAEQYGKTRGPLPPAPYPGAWVEADGRQRTPRGFTPGYLSFALVASLIIPAALLTLCRAAARPLATATLGPYLLVFCPQILLETRLLNRSIMTPVVPILFAFYRLWQLIRSLALVAKHTAAAAAGSGGGGGWLIPYLLSLLTFWVFDTGCTLLWLPGMFNWQLQDVSRLQHLARMREQQQLLLLQGRSGGSLLPAKLSDTGLAARAEGLDGRAQAGAGTAFGASSGAARHRRAAGAAGGHHEAQPSGGPDDMDSFGFGT